MTTCGDMAMFYIKSVDKFGNELKEACAAHMHTRTRTRTHTREQGGDPFEAKLVGPQQDAPVCACTLVIARARACDSADVCMCAGVRTRTCKCVCT